MIYLDPSHPGFGGVGSDSLNGKPNSFEAIATVATFTFFLRYFLQPISQFGDMLGLFQAAFAGANRAFAAFDAQEEFTEYERIILRIAKINFDAYKIDLLPRVLQSKQNICALYDRKHHQVTTSGKIEFDHVSFGYDQNKLVVRNLTFQVNPSETIAIVGPTGSGKSTIINLLAKFYELTSGDIKFDHYSIRQFTKQSIRQQVAIVFQNAFIFNETVIENIRFGDLRASDEEVIEAAKIAQCFDFIQKLPNGFQTKLGNGGYHLSQGQSQLIAIARAILSKAPILVFDEATSAVDTQTEQAIQIAMDYLFEHKTAFIIAHRLSTIQNADKIIVLKDGEIIEFGKHQELIELNGFYADLYRSQFDATNE